VEELPVLPPGGVCNSSVPARQEPGAGASVAPQLTQNFVPSTLFVPQEAQVAIVFSFKGVSSD
jgi:hypothetical protein